MASRPERVVAGVWGATGTGKTQTVRAIIRDTRLPPRIGILDLNHDYAEGVDVEAVLSSRGAVVDYLKPVKPGRPFSFAYRPRSDAPPEAAGFLARFMWAAGGCVMVIDEAHRSCRQNEVAPKVLDVALQGRHRRVSAIFASPRPVHVHTDIQGETFARESYFLPLAGGANFRLIERECGRDVADRVRELEDLHGIRYMRRKVTPFRVRLRPRPLAPALEFGPEEG